MARKLNNNKISVSTQQYLDIAEIKQNTIVMKDGTLRAVLLVSSINFALKSEEEQNATVAAYVGFLNNLSFPLQIVIQSRELNIDHYLEELKKRKKAQLNELLKMQTAEYIQYIEELISIGRIMNKRFYVSVPYDPSSDSHKSFFASMMDTFRPATIIKMKEKRFLRYKEALDGRILNIVNGFSSIGLNIVQLDTQSLIELFYNTYNPKTSKNQKLVDVHQLRVAD